MEVFDLTEKSLRSLYEDEGKTEKEIADLYNTYQVKVNRLRKKYGIETVSKGERLALPPLSPRQRAILTGSMLGDGRLLKTGSGTAAYSEHHSLEQEAYLRWKADEWGPYLKSIRPSNKTVDGKVYPGLILRTHGCPQLFPYWKKFYPEGHGYKTFQKPGRLSALALAIWYLDDGSKTWNGYVRLAVTPNKRDQAVLLALVAQLGLSPRYHENRDGSGPAIWIHDRTSLSKFLDLVSPHVPACMGYKLNITPRTRGTAPRHLLTKELLLSFTSQGWGSSRIARAMNVSVNSVRAALDKHGVPRPKQGRPFKQEVLDWDAAKEIIQKSQVTDGQLLDILVHLPSPKPPSQERALRDWEALGAMSDPFQTGVRYGNKGQALCNHFFAYRYDAGYESLPSVNRAWFDPKWVQKAIDFQRKVGDPVLPMNVHRAIRAILRAPTNFRPSLAKAIVEAYCPEGGLVLDPCAGYGGRATGTLAAGRGYYGIDPHPKAGAAYAALQEVVGPFDFENAPYEDTLLEGVLADLVFTSPPYFSKERYSDDPQQSWVRYPTWDLWVEGFLAPFVQKSWDHLKPGGHFLVNTKDIKIGRKTYPIVQELEKKALSRGFFLESRQEIPLGQLGKTKTFEPLLIFKKP